MLRCRYSRDKKQLSPGIAEVLRLENLDAPEWVRVKFNSSKFTFPSAFHHLPTYGIGPHIFVFGKCTRSGSFVCSIIILPQENAIVFLSMALISIVILPLMYAVLPPAMAPAFLSLVVVQKALFVGI